MSDRAKKGIFISLLTIAHAVITFFTLKKLPMVLFYPFQYTDAISFMIWTVYISLLYVITVLYEKKEKLSFGHFIKAVLFGLALTLGKGILDTAIDIIGQTCRISLKALAVWGQVGVLIFGVFLFALLQFWAAKRKPEFGLKKIKLPAMMILAAIIIYAVLVYGIFRDCIAFAGEYTLTETELYNLDLYCGTKILTHNMWNYPILYMLILWCIQRLSGEERGNKKALQKEDYAVIILTVLHGLVVFLLFGEIPDVFFSIKELFIRWQGFLVWMLFGTGIYWIVQHMLLGKKVNGKILLQSLICGILTGLGKGILDTAVIHFVLLKFDMTLCTNAVFLEITTLLTGLSLFLVLFLKTTPISFSFSKETVKRPLFSLFLLMTAYGALCGRCVYLERNTPDNTLAFIARGYEVRGVQELELINHINILMYVSVFLLFWWLMRSMTIVNMKEKTEHCTEK